MAGQFIAMKIHVQSGNTRNRFRLRLPIKYGSGWNWYSSPYYDLPPDFDGQGFYFTAQALEDGEANAYLQIHSPEGEGAPIDTWVGTDAWSIAIGDSEEEALAQVAEEYFDGDTPDYIIREDS